MLLYCLDANLLILNANNPGDQRLREWFPPPNGIQIVTTETALAVVEWRTSPNVRNNVREQFKRRNGVILPIGVPFSYFHRSAIEQRACVLQRTGQYSVNYDPEDISQYHAAAASSVDVILTSDYKFGKVLYPVMTGAYMICWETNEQYPNPAAKPQADYPNVQFVG